jgi:lantibiotic modifying enzyme
MDAADGHGCGDVLVVGTRDTLEPIATSRVLRDDERLAGEEIPPFAEELLALWMNWASREVNSVRMLAKYAVAGKPIGVDSLLGVLKRRLSELLSSTLGVWTGGEDLATFWRTYPALRSLVARSVQDWAEATTLFVERLAHDQALLAQHLGVMRLPAVTSLQATASDLHPHGAMVLRVGFAGGRDIFYKPRPVTGEWLWWTLLDAMAAKIQLPAGRVVFGGQPGGPSAYGWMQSVHDEEAWPGRQRHGPVGAAWSYWESAGAVLCLAQHLRLTDLHMGNVLATRPGPAITDAECLGAVGTAVDGFAGVMQWLRETGLLPQSPGHNEIDASGLFGRAGAVSGLRLSSWAVSQRGMWRLIESPAAVVRHGNLPRHTDAISPRDVAAQLCCGYRSGAELLMQVRGQLLLAGSAWRQILETQHAPRCVLRETLFYGKLLSRSLAAQRMKDQRERRRALTASLSAGSAALPERVVQAEVRALMAGCVPRLVISPGSRSLRDSDGRLLKHNFSRCTPAESVVRELESLTTARLEETLLPALLAALLG